MYNIVRKTLEVYLKEKRLVNQSELESTDLQFLAEKKAIFVTLYGENKVIASAGRIQPQKENSLNECIDIALNCLKDPRFSANLQNPESLSSLKIRVDSFSGTERKILKNISEISSELGLIFLSQKLGKMSVILPNMLTNNPSPEKLFEIAKKKAGIETAIEPADYIIYSFPTTIYKNF